MSNYPAGAESYLASEDAFNARYAAIEDSIYESTLEEIADAPWDFHHEYEIFDIDAVSDFDIKRITSAWAHNMQRDSAWAEQQAGVHHAKLLSSFQHKLDRSVERELGE